VRPETLQAGIASVFRAFESGDLPTAAGALIDFALDVERDALGGGAIVMSEPIDKAKKMVTGAAALGMLVKVEVNEDFDEVDRVAFAGVPIFSRDEGSGRPRLFGIPFKRWIRGPR
jgi:hypothetical protein